MVIGSIISGGTAYATRATTERVSVSVHGSEGNADSLGPSISARGRFVAFSSEASNLVPNDTNGVSDTFVNDRRLGTTERVSLSSDGSEGNGESRSASISPDGRFVVFDSFASNLVEGDTNGTLDVFVHDRKLDTTERVSVSSDEAEGDSTSWFPSISADGRFVAFESHATNLVEGDTNRVRDIFVRDRLLGVTRRVSLNSRGAESDDNSYLAAISADGRLVAFLSYATNLVPRDTNDASDVFVRDLRRGTTERVSVSSAEAEGDGRSYDPSISARGRFVGFSSVASNIVPGDTNQTGDVFVRDLKRGTTRRMSLSSNGEEGNAASFGASMSASSRFIAFHSESDNLARGDANGVTDIFVRDRRLGITIRVSVSWTGAEGNGGCYIAEISADGRSVAFASGASNLVPDDTNDAYDIFVRSR
jgi:Tol biopolymer transport system component